MIQPRLEIRINELIWVDPCQHLLFLTHFRLLRVILSAFRICCRRRRRQCCCRCRCCQFRLCRPSMSVANKSGRRHFPDFDFEDRQICFFSIESLFRLFLISGFWGKNCQLLLLPTAATTTMTTTTTTTTMTTAMTTSTFGAANEEKTKDFGSIRRRSDFLIDRNDLGRSFRNPRIGEKESSGWKVGPDNFFWKSFKRICAHGPFFLGLFSW